MSHRPVEDRLAGARAADHQDPAPATSAGPAWAEHLEVPVRFVRMLGEDLYVTRLPELVSAHWSGVTELHLAQDAVSDEIRNHRLNAQTWLIAQIALVPSPGLTSVTGRGLRLLRGAQDGPEVQAALQRLRGALQPEDEAPDDGPHTPSGPAEASGSPDPDRLLAAGTTAMVAGVTGQTEDRRPEPLSMQPSGSRDVTASAPATAVPSAGPRWDSSPALWPLLQQLPARLKEQQHMMDPGVLREALLAVLTSCVTGQLTLFSGPPGMGKTSVVEHLAVALDAELSVTPVRPAWMEATDLLGFYSARQERYQPTAFLEALLAAAAEADGGRYHLLTLDELNLSRIENYGADLLSQLEKVHQSARGGELRLYADGLQAPPYPARLALPANVVLIGTLNTDETTEALSPKVLDRSFVVKLPAFALKDRGFPDPFDVQTARPPEPLHALRRDAFRDALRDADLATFKPAWRTLLDWQSKFMTPLGLHLSFRTERVFNLYVRVAALLGVTPDQALDAFTSSKVLPSLHFLRYDTTKLEMIAQWRQTLPPGCKQTARHLDAMLATTGDVIEYFGR